MNTFGYSPNSTGNAPENGERRGSHASARRDCTRPETCVDRHRGWDLVAVFSVIVDRGPDPNG
ncbi:MAG: hypothetical protein ACQET5_05110 [Halobacteriota archaeon]